MCCKQLRTNGDKNNHLKAHSDVKFQLGESFKATSQVAKLSPQVKMLRVAKVKQGFLCEKCLKIISFRSYLKQNQLIQFVSGIISV